MSATIIIVVIAIILIIAVAAYMWWPAASTESTESTKTTGTQQTTAPETTGSAVTPGQIVTQEMPFSAIPTLYGFKSTTAPTGYGLVSMEASQCRAMGGATNGTPADGSWADCHFNFGKQAEYYPSKSGTCPGGPTGVFWTSRPACDLMGGRSNYAGDPTDCHVNLCQSRSGGERLLGFSPVCPAGTKDYGRAQIQMVRDDCLKTGGTPADSNAWTKCTWSVCGK